MYHKMLSNLPIYLSEIVGQFVTDFKLLKRDDPVVYSAKLLLVVIM